jgi:hypothetical protein
MRVLPSSCARTLASNKKNPRPTIGRGFCHSRLIFQDLLTETPQELAPAPLSGRLLRHRRASPSAALDKGAISNRTD